MTELVSAAEFLATESEDLRIALTGSTFDERSAALKRLIEAAYSRGWDEAEEEFKNVLALAATPAGGVQ